MGGFLTIPAHLKKNIIVKNSFFIVGRGVIGVVENNPNIVFCRKLP